MNRPKRILIVDDDPRFRSLLRNMIESLGHEVENACDGFGALAKVRLGVDLVVLDVVLPGLDGFEVIRQLRHDEATADLPVLMVTGHGNRQHRIRAIRDGASDFLTKPVDMLELSVRLSFHLKMKEAQDEIRRHRSELEGMLEQRTTTLRKALDDMVKAQRLAHQSQLETIHRLAVAAEFKDKDTGAHIRRMSHYSAIIARALGLPPSEVSTIFHASPMHDVGKLGIPDKNLLKPGKLDDDEWTVMKQHTVIGSRILSGSQSELLQAGEVIALSHHEKWNGGGYPQGLTEEDIPLWGRICAVGDVFDALTSRRPYKGAFTNRDAYELMHEGRGEHFDPKILDTFFENRDEIEEVQRSYRDEELLAPISE